MIYSRIFFVIRRAITYTINVERIYSQLLHQPRGTALGAAKTKKKMSNEVESEM